MGLFSKTPSKDQPEATGALDPKDKPLPDLAKRPGTSGTELGLRANRQKASTAYERAQRAEQAYRAQRRATYAKNDLNTAKEHYSTAWTSFKAATLYSWHVFKAGPAVLQEGARVKRTKQVCQFPLLNAQSERSRDDVWRAWFLPLSWIVMNNAVTVLIP